MSRSSPSAAQAVDEPRRGGRARKAVERYEPIGATAHRSKRRQESDDEDSDEQDGEDAEVHDEETEEEDEQTTPKQSRKRKSAASAPKNNHAAPKRVKRKSVAAVHGQAAGGTQEKKEDSPFYNAMYSPDIALLPLIEDWVDTYQQSANDETSEKASVHELVLFFIRCCGLASDIEEDEALDADGVVDTLERIQDESVKTSLAVYPLIARTKEAKTFRTNLNIFIPHLVKTISLTPLLYETAETTSHTGPIIPLLLNWLHSMSSSPLRPIRHTSTHLALKVNSALCDIAASVASELALKQRQKDAEAKKGGTGPTAQKKVKDLEAKVNEARAKKARLAEYMKETFDVMYVHRVRDSDPAIRADCFKELGVWVKKYGEGYLTTGRLNYFQKGCNDLDSKARLETVKALPNLFTSTGNASRAQPVILRLAPRLVEMALRDVDLNVRINALHVVTELDKTGTLEDDDEEKRASVIKLVFDAEPRVRRAVGGFVRGLWEQRLEELKSQWSTARPSKKKKAGKVSDDEMEIRLGYKALATMLVETAKSLESPNQPSTSSKALSSTAQAMTRASAVVEALWDAFEELQTWEAIVEYLLLDHSEAVDMWLLTEDEESLLLQMLVASIQRDVKDDEDEEDEQTKILINVLPRLFTKHQADSERMSTLLLIPFRMKLSLYLDLRKTAAYETLWDDVSKQFLQHTDPILLTAATQTITHLSANSAMATVNSSKISDLDESVFSSLRDAINGEEVFGMSLDEDRLAIVQAILLRITLLFRSRDLVDVMQDTEGGQSSGWDIVCAFAERGEVGYKEEAKTVEYAIQAVFLHLTWLCRRFTEEDQADETKITELEEKRDRAKDIFDTLALRDRTNAAEPVRRQALIAYLNLHHLFARRQTFLTAKASPMEVADDVQHRLGGAFSAIVERYASDLDDQRETEDEEPTAVEALERAQEELVFAQLASTFVAAIRIGVLEVDHAREPLAHFGRFGAAYDAVVKKVIDVLRDEGIYNKAADTVQHVASSALQSSFDIFHDSDNPEPTASIALAKLLATGFVIQGTNFTVLKQLHPSDVADLHTGSIDYITKKIASIKKQSLAAKFKSAKERHTFKLAQALSFFKCLVHLLGPVTGRDAAEIRKHLDSSLETTGAIVGTSKIWDGYKAYEKRLIAIASKDPSVKVVAQQERKKVREEEDMTEGDDDQVAVTPSKSLRIHKRKEPEPEEDELEEENAAQDDDALELGDLAVAEDVPETMDFDLELDLELPPSQIGRERSPSQQPQPKKRRKVREL